MEGLDACALNATSVRVAVAASIDAIRVTADEADAPLSSECARSCVTCTRLTDCLQFEGSTTDDDCQATDVHSLPAQRVKTTDTALPETSRVFVFSGELHRP